MKASLKFREERKPLVKAKVNVGVLGLPFLAGATAGETKDLRLDIATAFFSGPSVRVSYRPNDSWNPFSLVVRTGIGAFGSPASSPLTMSAEFNLLGGGPSFVIRLKPRAGDFFLKKAVRSAVVAPPPPSVGCQGSGDSDDPPGVRYLPEKSFFSRGFPNGTGSLIPVVDAGGGAELGACSVLPLWNNTIAKFHWGLRLPSDLPPSFPGELRSIGRQYLRHLPTLAMGKITIEHKYGEGAAASTPPEDAVKRDLVSLQEETASLRKAVEELRAAKPPSEWRDRWAREGDKPVARPSSFSRNGGDAVRKSDARTAEPTKDDVSEELRKALIGATGGH